MMGNKKDFYRYIIIKVKSKENVCLLLSGAEKLGTKETEKAKVLNAFFTSVFTSKTGFQDSPVSEISEKVWNKENPPPVGEDQIDEKKADVNKYEFPDRSKEISD
ncbi:hypothetical protein llap_1501 [Limosa lapponica baueri]|uniref:Uncharacterized protein n=1 Tax=Limosa lapponica baueri TaxID=1758121 RepID=A0A2I0UQA4_LIMLA|nr:hypothetical protein llap_1501 [Limosa lapponica baueri]